MSLFSVLVKPVFAFSFGYSLTLKGKKKMISNVFGEWWGHDEGETNKQTKHIT